MNRLRSDESGIAVVIAVTILFMLMLLGLAVLNTVDGQQRAVQNQRLDESGYALSEASLEYQVARLTYAWPFDSAAAYPATCVSSGGASAGCPDPPTIAAGYAGGAYTGSSWTTWVRDNSAGGQPPSGAPYTKAAYANPTYDANGDNQVWVGAQSTVRGATSTVVSLSRLAPGQIAFPHAVIIAGSLDITNRGNHGGRPIVDTKGNAAQPGNVYLRCDVNQQSCVNSNPTSGQISPWGQGQVVGNYASNPTLSAKELASLKRFAQANGTYSTSCPASLTGQVVYIDVAASTQCSYQGNSTYNSASSPGVVVLPNGSVSLGGTTTFYGLIYAANLTGSNDVLVNLGGATTIVGAIIIDGPGALDAGSTSVNLVYDDNVFGKATGYSAASFVPGTRRRCAGATSPSTAC